MDGIAVDGPEGSRLFTLQDPEDPYRILAERMNEGVATLSAAKGVVLYGNRRLGEMVGVPAERLLGIPLVSILHEKGKASFPGLMRKAQVTDVRAESCLRHRDGALIPVQLSLSRLGLKETGASICLVATDLSERTRTEAALRRGRERQLRLKDELLSHVSHELRSPMACIHQFATILLDGLSGPLTEEQREVLGIILKSANQLRKMIDDLLETARIEAGKVKLEWERVVVQDAAHEAIEMLRSTASEKAICLKQERREDPLLVHADPHRVRQILLNLIGNALRFTPEGGRVEVKYRVEPGDAGYAVVTVHDNGCGMSEAVQARVFERLYQEGRPKDHGHGGLGLGLAICKELVLLHTGKIWVESRPGRGSAFSFTLPMYGAGKKAAAGARSGTTHAGG